MIDRRTIRRGLKVIAAGDSDVGQALERVGYPEPRIRPAGFETLLSIIVSQQVSTGASRTIMGRVRSLLPELSAEATLALPEGALREAGLSRRKAEYATGLARTILDGRFNPAALAGLGDSEASAEIYVMFSLQRPDVFPADDLALQRALQNLKGWSKRPAAAEAREAVVHWSPWRTVGSLFLWHLYRAAPI